MLMLLLLLLSPASIVAAAKYTNVLLHTMFFRLLLASLHSVMCVVQFCTSCVLMLYVNTGTSS